MSLIAIPYFNKDKLLAHVCACTEEEYKKYMESVDNINPYTIGANYFRQYISDKGHILINSEQFEKRVVFALGKGAFVQWQHAPVFTCEYVKEMLNEFQLDYFEFIDVYAKFLKIL